MRLKPYHPFGGASDKIIFRFRNIPHQLAIEPKRDVRHLTGHPYAKKIPIIGFPNFTFIFRLHWCTYLKHITKNISRTSRLCQFNLVSHAASDERRNIPLLQNESSFTSTDKSKSRYFLSDNNTPPCPNGCCFNVISPFFILTSSVVPWCVVR